MKIFNKTAKKVICDDALLAETFFSRFLGLMFSSERKNILIKFPKEGMNTVAIHMFFMKFPIDVIWINSKNRIVTITRDITPSSIFKISTWKIYKPKEKARYVLELGNRKVDDEVKEGNEVEFFN